MPVRMTCHICGKKFMNPILYAAHMRQVHGIG